MDFCVRGGNQVSPVIEDIGSRDLARSFSRTRQSSSTRVTSEPPYASSVDKRDTKGYSPGLSQDMMPRSRSLLFARKTSTFSLHGQSARGSIAPNLAMRHGSLASYFSAPHPIPGKGVCFSPSGEVFIRYGFSPELKLLKSHNGSVINTLKGSHGNIRYASFSTDGKFIIAASDDCRVILFNVEDAITGIICEAANIDVGAEPVSYCLLSPDSSVLLSCDDEGQLETWNTGTGEMIMRYDIGHASVLASFAMDGKYIVSCADFECELVLVDVITAEIIDTDVFRSLEEGRNKAGYAISPDGSLIVTFIKEQTWGNNLALYNVETRTSKGIRVCEGSATHVELSTDGFEFFAAGRDNNIYVYDASSLILVCQLQGHNADVMYCKASGDRHMAISGDTDGCVIIWDVDRGQGVLRLQAHNQPLMACDMSSDCSRAYTLDAAGHAYLWYIDMQSVFDAMQQETEELTCCCLLADGSSMLIGYTDGSLKMWKLGSYISKDWEHSQHSSPIQCIAVDEINGIVASGCRDGEVVLTALSNGQILNTVKGHDDVITCIAFSANGGRLLTSSWDNRMGVWEVQEAWRVPKSSSSSGADTSTGSSSDSMPVVCRSLQMLRLQEDSVSCISRCAIDPLGNLAVAATMSGKVCIWDIITGLCLSTVKVSSRQASTLAFTTDGRFLIVGSSDGYVTILDASKGLVLRRVHGNSAGITSAYFEDYVDGCDLSDCRLVTVCGRQAMMWDLNKTGATIVRSADFIPDKNAIFRNQVMEGRVFVAHEGLSFFDPYMSAVMYDLRNYDMQTGNSSLFREGTLVVSGGVHHCPMIMYTPPDKTICMLSNETGSIKTIDFSSNGKLLVAGNLRGELSIWDIVHHQNINSWMAHKRSAITTVKFSNDTTNVYSSGEDCKVIVWDWKECTQLSVMVGHQAPVTSVEMSMDGSILVSGDREGTIIIWDAITQQQMQVLQIHDGPVLSCSISPSGKQFISSGQDEQICIIDCATGERISSLDEALDGKGLTVKYSFDGTRVQIGGEKGNILIWSIERNCLLFDIQAHTGKVYDCSWSGDSRLLLSVGTDGRARLWDAAAGSELCEANFENGFGAIESGGFIKCDLSADGSTMAGCTSKGHLLQWDLNLELRKAPNGQMLYQWLASMPNANARAVYASLSKHFPLIHNLQDSRGWTVLMHAAEDSNSEVIKLILDNISVGKGSIGLMVSPMRKVAQIASKPLRSTNRLLSGVMSFTSNTFKDVKIMPSSDNPDADARGVDQDAEVETEEPNTIKIAIAAASAECVHHILTAVLDEKVNRGSYSAVTLALPEVAQLYPSMCEAFLCRLPVRILGEIEIPSLIAKQGVTVKAATSYTSYKELWNEALKLAQVDPGPMVVMQAAMVQLPFAGSLGNESLLLQLVESDVGVGTYGCETVKAVIDFKWQKFARNEIYTKAIVYASFLAVYTAFAITYADDPGSPRLYFFPTGNVTIEGESVSYYSATIGVDLKGLATTQEGQAEVAFCFIVFFYGVYYMVQEAEQLYKLGPMAYFTNFWNFLDIAGYAMAIGIPPFVLFRVGLNEDGYIPALVAVEAILLWTKGLFFGLAIDGLGTFVYMTVEIVKGLKYFYIMLLVLYISFAIAFENLFRIPGGRSNLEAQPFKLRKLFDEYGTFPDALLSAYASTYGGEDPRLALHTIWPSVSIVLICMYNFLIIVILLNMIITLMGDLYKKIKDKQEVVFLKNRADLILEVETTMNAQEMKKHESVPPFLHLLRPIQLDGPSAEDGDGEGGGFSGVMAALTKLLATNKQEPSKSNLAGDEVSVSPIGDAEGLESDNPQKMLPSLTKQRTLGRNVSLASHGKVSTSGAAPSMGLERLVLDLSKEVAKLKTSLDAITKHHDIQVEVPAEEEPPSRPSFTGAKERRKSRVSMAVFNSADDEDSSNVTSFASRTSIRSIPSRKFGSMKQRAPRPSDGFPGRGPARLEGGIEGLETIVSRRPSMRPHEQNRESYDDEDLDFIRQPSMSKSFSGMSRPSYAVARPALSKAQGLAAGSRSRPVSAKVRMTATRLPSLPVLQHAATGSPVGRLKHNEFSSTAQDVASEHLDARLAGATLSDALHELSRVEATKEGSMQPSPFGQQQQQQQQHGHHVVHFPDLQTNEEKQQQQHLPVQQD
ncbi:hypothetical protein CEUSTIGMA_g2473.t1 [Chlamydomonas eustigma]|uniref:Ion transport domain-containing protein n=1 Tax=Chlamydomonas eustigma TaxID=1157962 RepID=A0A250WW18_9CHLO|nr:hypothetical protein CEUSTIGMA_g2473.t1 [Chlamydomonas eustigma]|eukprot:GAX75027.1 hypothetical protein CEUSTIGMA_g2473.t1 [Chlamydomonas eustigma]